jgi:hypothetical protein
MNPAMIKPSTHFLCGKLNLQGDVKSLVSDYGLREEILNSHGINTYNPFSFFDINCLQALDKSNNYLNIQISCLAMCSSLVTIPGWEFCDSAKKVVEIGRLMGKEIILFEKLVIQHAKPN